MSMAPTIASVLDALSDVTSLVTAALAFGALFLLLWGFERV
jgi:hypothetical protein